MRILRFPSEEPLPDQGAWVAELEAALEDDGQGPAAESWRQLRSDVRSLAPPIDPDFAARLALELQRRAALRRTTVGDRADVAPESAVGAAGPAATAPRADDPHAHQRPARRSGRALLGRLERHRRSAIGGSLAAAVALIAALVVAGGGGSGGRVPVPPGPVRGLPAQAGTVAPAVKGANAPLQAGRQGIGGSSGTSSAAASAETQSAATSSSSSAPAGAAAPGRVQQLGASITLGTTPANVQGVSDEIGRIAVRFGGYVQASSVQTQTQGVSEGTLSLRTPSAKLGAMLAAIAQLASVRAENQSLQDITGSYNSAHQRLTDALAERQALLRALASATGEGQVDSLRARLAEARNAITQAQSAFNSIAHQAATAEVEVTVRGDQPATSEGLSVHRGLRDAGKVLLVTLTAILILAAVLVPLGLLAAAISGGRSALRRRRREQILDGR